MKTQFGTEWVRIVYILLPLLLLIGCQQPTKYRIGVSQCSYDDWRLKLNDELERQALLYPEVELEIVSAYDDPERQQRDVRRFIDEKFDVIITSPHDSLNLNDVLREAREQGIKVLVFDREPSQKNYDIFITADNAMLGRAAGNFLIRSKNGKANILELWGTPSTSPALGRHSGFMEALAAYPESRHFAEGVGNWNEEEAEVVTDSLLALYPETDAIFAHNDRMALGARKATRKAGRTDILIAGVDAVPELGIKAVADNIIDATFVYPTAGKELIDFAVKAARGEELKDELIISTAQPVVPDNASILLEIGRAVDDEKAKVDYLHEQVDIYSARHTEQRALLIAIVAIVILLALIIFILLRAYWQRRRSQEMLYLQNVQLMKHRDELEQLNVRLNEATQAKLVFFTNVSHDLRTPLTLISEPVAQLKDSPNLNADEQVLVRLADKNVKILQRLINQILDFRKYENGKLNLNLQEVDLRRYIEEWAESFQYVAHKRHIKFELKFGDMEKPTVAIDPGKIERVFFNLMSNAFKFTPANGSITSEVSLKDGKLTLKVSDTGRGMNEETLQHVFERFYQADKVEPRGSGIGLALVKAFVNLHGGEVNVESVPDKGSVFTVVIPEKHIESSPVSPSSASSIKSTSTQASGSSDSIASELDEISNPDVEEIDESKPCVLVIDDTADVRTLVKTLMKKDYTVLEASSGKQGVKLATKYIPDLIICDVMMPGMTGMECCRRLKSEISTSHIPVLMLTACSLDEQRTEGYEAGADGYLSKPFNSSVLLARCRSLIANRRLLLAAKSDLANPSTVPTPATLNSGLSEEKHEVASGQVSPVSARSNAGDVASTADEKPAEAASARVKKTARTADLAVENEFYQRFMKVVDNELSNPDISVEEIGARLGLSRVQFYRKIKALTNYSPNEILRIRRLKYAYRQLTSTESTVAEVAYSVGFSSPSYFAKCFKEYFNELPAEVQKRTSKL